MKGRNATMVSVSRKAFARSDDPLHSLTMSLEMAALYKLRSWVDVDKLDWNNLSKNPKETLVGYIWTYVKRPSPERDE